METTSDLLFLTAVAFIFTHELDAIQQHEWRFFFAPVPLSDRLAYQVFTTLHLPLFIAILWYLPSESFQLGFDVFTLIHAGLHWGLRNHPNVTFNNGFSRLWVFGAALLGALHLVIGLI